MKDDIFFRAWEIVQDTEPPEHCPDDHLKALFQILPDAPVQLSQDLELSMEESQPELSWVEMVLGRSPEEALEDWVFRASNLIIIGSLPGPNWIGVDLFQDHSGNHRIYEIQNRSASLLFPSISSLFQWIVDPVKLAPQTPDNWAAHPSSIEFCFPLLWKLHPSSLYQSYRMQSWPGETPELPEVEINGQGWQRTAIIWTLGRFLEKRRVELPEGVNSEEISEEHEDLIINLAELEGAMHDDEVPIWIAELSLDEDDEVSELALDWMDRFDRARDPGSKEETTEVANKTQWMLGLLQQGLKELTRLEYIEVPQQHQQKLTEEMFEAVVQAGNPNRALQSLVETLLDSPHVEEVYADDADLQRVLSQALGMTG